MSRWGGTGDGREFRRISGVGWLTEWQVATEEWGLSRIRNFVNDRDGDDDGERRIRWGGKFGEDRG